jgi:ribosomal protein S8
MKMKITRKNILEYEEKYNQKYRGTDGSKVEKEMKRLLKNRGYLTRANLITIGDWKAPRARRHYRKNRNQRVRKISKSSFSTKDEKKRIESLDSLRGVGYPIASTILHFAFPHKYPIMDFRVIRSLGLKQPSTYKFDFWKGYCKKMQAIAKKYRLPMRTVDKALWKYDELNSGRRRTCGQHE